MKKVYDKSVEYSIANLRFSNLSAFLFAMKKNIENFHLKC